MNEKYFAIIQKIINGQEPTPEEYKIFIEYLPKIDEKKLKELTEKSQFKNPDGSVLKMTPEETTKLLTLISQKAMSSPEAKEVYLSHAEKIAKTEFGSKIATVLNTTLGIGDVLSANKQVKEARKLARQSRRPNAPAPLTKDPQLQHALSEAQQGSFDSYRKLAPAKQAILDQYLSDLNTAATASTGQAGTYGALGQVASTRRGRNELSLAPVLDSIKAREESRYDNLLAMNLGENQAIQQSVAQNYPHDLNQYQMEQQAIGNLGSQGRQNFRQSLTNLGQQATQGLSDFAAKRKFAKLRANLANFPGAYDARVEAERDVNNAWNGNYQYINEAELRQQYGVE